MNIRITNLSLTNFKCFRSKEITFEGDITTIRGRNGAGKTTIADAILFCLFGKNSEGQSDLELFKTRADGQVIPNLDHSVEMTLAIGGSPADKSVTLRRSIKEVWVKKRGSEESVFKNNTVEYYVNGDSYTKADYEKYISTLIDERVFRAITNPNYFPSLKWQDQRAFLTTLAGDVEVPADNVEFAALLKQLSDSDEDVITYLKHLKYQIKQVKDKLEKVPVRLEEQNKALPERLDWDAIQSECSEVSLRCKDLDSKILAIKQGNGSDVKRAELRKQISELTNKLAGYTEKANIDVMIARSEHTKAVSEKIAQFNLELGNQKLMEQTIGADGRLIERCKQTIKECDEELERLRLAWPNRKFSIDTSKAICPTCGQPLPEEQWMEKQNEMRDNFNKALAAEKQALRDKAARVNQNREDAQQELTSNENKLRLDTESLADIKQSINTIFSEKAKLEKEHLPTVDELLAANVEYVALSKQLTDLQSALDSVTDSDVDQDALTSLTNQRTECNEVILRCQQQLATRAQYDRILALIDGINAEQKDLIRQLSDLEHREDIARQYQFRQNQLLEERINKHFKLVQWRLFRTVNNSGDSFEEPFCECYVDGVPYHSGLNQAARLNAGLDICEALCRFYNVSAPIVIDNAESNLNIYQTTGQQIRLQVHDSDLTLV